MAIAKITLNGVSQIDLTFDTVTAETLKSGRTATGADGESISGTYAPEQYVQTMIASTSSATTSTTFENEYYSQVTLQITGTSTSRTLYAEGRCDTSGPWVTLAFSNLVDNILTDGSTGIKANGAYSVSIAGITEFRVRLASVSGGNVKVEAVFVR